MGWSKKTDSYLTEPFKCASLCVHAAKEEISFVSGLIHTYIPQTLTHTIHTHHPHPYTHTYIHTVSIYLCLCGLTCDLNVLSLKPLTWLSSPFLKSVCDPAGMNSTQISVAYFIIQGLDSLGDVQTALFVLFLVAYIIILGGNSMIIFLVRTQNIVFIKSILLRSFDTDV